MMKISLPTDQLTAALQAASRVAAPKASIQALSGAMISAKDGKVELKATDHEMSLCLPLPAIVDEEGQALVPAKLLADVARQLPGDSCQLHLEDQELKITSGSATFSLRVLRAEDFPVLPDPLEGTGVSLPAEQFFSSLAQVSKSASHDETRPILTGVLVSVEGDLLQMVATDSYRMALKKTALPEPVAHDFEAIIPARALEELAKLVGKQDQISIMLQDSRIVFLADEIVFSCSLLAGSFPNFRQLIPTEFEHELNLPVGQLKDMTKRISLMARQSAPVRLSFSEGKLKMTAQTPDIGQAEETMDVPFSGEAMELGFAPEYLLSGLESMNCKELSLKLISPIRPALIVANDSSGFLYLMMPIRLSV